MPTFARSARNNCIPKRDTYILHTVQTLSEMQRGISCLVLRRSAIIKYSILRCNNGNICKRGNVSKIGNLGSGGDSGNVGKVGM